MANNRTPLTASNIKYLLVIHHLDRDDRGVRCTDVADFLHVTKPSVHRMMLLLKEMDLIHKDKSDCTVAECSPIEYRTQEKEVTTHDDQ